MKNFILFLTLLIVSTNTWSSGGPSHCTHLKTERSILKCLNAFAAAHLDENSEANMIFEEEIERHAHLYGLDRESLQKNSLKEFFKVYVEKKSRLKGENKNKKCFVFSNDRAKRANQIANIEFQIYEATKFLALFHANTLGRQTSLLFPIKELSICSLKNNGNRPMAFRGRRLHFGIDMDDNKYYPADSLLEIWNTGNPIRVSDRKSILPGSQKVRDIYHGVQGNLDAILRDKIAEKWNILNPIGEKRTKAISIVMEMVTKGSRLSRAVNLKEQMSEDEFAVYAYNEMMTTLAGPGFNQRHFELLEQAKTNPAQVSNIYLKWQRKMNDIKTVASFLESGLVQKSQGSDIVIMAREQSSLIASYANNHEISVNISQLLAVGPSLERFEEKDETYRNAPQEELIIEKDGLFSDTTIKLKMNAGSKLHTNVDETSGLLFAGNTSDVVNVKMNLPRINYSTYKRATLFDVLEEGTQYLD